MTADDLPLGSGAVDATPLEWWAIPEAPSPKLPRDTSPPFPRESSPPLTAPAGRRRLVRGGVEPRDYMYSDCDSPAGRLARRWGPSVRRRAGETKACGWEN